jgi:hypothetical protein
MRPHLLRYVGAHLVGSRFLCPIGEASEVTDRTIVASVHDQVLAAGDQKGRRVDTSSRPMLRKDGLTRIMDQQTERASLSHASHHRLSRQLSEPQHVIK